jgi:hypothetical protein
MKARSLRYVLSGVFQPGTLNPEPLNLGFSFQLKLQRAAHLIHEIVQEKIPKLELLFADSEVQG